MTKIWVKFVPKKSDIVPKSTKGITLTMDQKCKSKAEKSSKVLHTFNTQPFLAFDRS